MRRKASGYVFIKIRLDLGKDEDRALWERIKARMGWMPASCVARLALEEYLWRADDRWLSHANAAQLAPGDASCLSRNLAGYGAATATSERSGARRRHLARRTLRR